MSLDQQALKMVSHERSTRTYPLSVPPLYKFYKAVEQWTTPCLCFRFTDNKSMTAITTVAYARVVSVEFFNLGFRKPKFEVPSSPKSSLFTFTPSPPHFHKLLTLLTWTSSIDIESWPASRLYVASGDKAERLEMHRRTNSQPQVPQRRFIACSHMWHLRHTPRTGRSYIK